MDTHQSVTNTENYVGRVGEWARHVNYSGQEYFYNVKSQEVQMEKPKEWLEYEEQKGPVPSQSFSTACNILFPSLFSLHQQQNQSHQSSPSSSNITDHDFCSNTVSSETAAATNLQMLDYSPRNQSLDLNLSHSQNPSSSYQHDNSNNEMGLEEYEVINLEDSNSTVSLLEISDTDLEMCYEEIPSILHIDDLQDYNILSLSSDLPEDLVEENQGQSDCGILRDENNLDMETNIMNGNSDTESDEEHKNRDPEKRKTNSMNFHQSASKEVSFNMNSFHGLFPKNSEEKEIPVAKRQKEEKNPLQMQKIFSKIISFLDVASIKNARQVNPLWSVEGAKVLISKCFVKIPPDLNPHYFSRKNTFKMEQFKVFLSHNSKDILLIPHIIVKAATDVELWKLLGVLGPPVKSLKLNNVDEKEKLDNLPDLLSNLLDLLPNLKYLDFKDFNFYKHKNAIIRVLNTAMSKTERNGNPLIISHLTLEPNNEEGLDDMEKFSDCKNIMIENLKFQKKIDFFSFWCGVPNFEPRIVNIMSKLLCNSQNILKELSLFDCEMYLSFLEFPCLTAVTHIYLGFHLETPGTFRHRKFSPSFRFSEKVPNLHDMTINCMPYTVIRRKGVPMSFFKNLLKNTGSAPSVKRVNCFGGHSDFTVHPLFKTFPNAQVLNMSVNNCVETRLHSLWTLGKNLKILSLDMDLQPLMQNFDVLDSIFSGFTPHTVNRMKSGLDSIPCTLDELNELRVNPSIVQLQELEHLTIHLRGLGQEWPEGMLAVAGNFAFKLMAKDLRILIHVEDTKNELECARKSLDEVSQLANVNVLFQEIQMIPTMP